MSATRIPSLIELSVKSKAGGTNPSVRDELEIYSSTEVDNLLGSIDLSAYALNTTVNNVTGSLSVTNVRVAEISGNVIDLTSDLNILSVEVVGISSDVYDLDLSLTSSIYNYITIDGTAPATTATKYAWGRINSISGAPLYLQLFR
jgi:hypothetical protein